MRVGVLARGETDQLTWAANLKFRSIEWVAFEQSPIATQVGWKDLANPLRDTASHLDVRISAIGVYYKNPLDPKQTAHALALWRRAFEVAEYLQIRTVAGFPGAIIEMDDNERSGAQVYRPFESFIPQLVRFWEPLAKEAADHGLRIAFEHCPQGPYHLPIMHFNMLAQPAMWSRFFDACPSENIGIEWDPSHLICQLIDPLTNLREFSSRIFHVHAKDAWIDRPLLERFGICHPGVAEHRFPGLGQSNWAEIIRGLITAGYDSDLNIEGWHDPVYRDHPDDETGPLAGRALEEDGLRIARHTLEQFLPKEIHRR